MSRPEPGVYGDGAPHGAPPFGIGFAAHSGLAARAIEAVHARPRSTAWLAREVLGLRGAPAGLAARMVFELLGNERRVRVDDRGVWVPALPQGTDGVGLHELTYTVVDVETTGISPRSGGRIVEIALVEVSGGRVGGEFCSLVNPGCAVPGWITGLTGITTAMVADAPPFDEVCDLVRARLEGRVFVAHNASYDWAFVSEEMRRARALLPCGPRLCTLRLARRALPGLRRRGLDSLADYYGIPVEGRHRARGDAVATALVLVRLLAEADRRGIRSWGGLDMWMRGQAPPCP